LMKIKKFQVKQKLNNYFSALSSEDRKSLIREEVQDELRLGISKLAKNKLYDLVTLDPAPKELRLQGYPTYRILRHKISEEFNYINPCIKGQRQSDFVISRYKKPEYKMCSLDVVNAVAYLAFMDPEKAL
jgi:hypothetical protein